MLPNEAMQAELVVRIAGMVDASDAFDKFLTASTITHEYRRTEYEPIRRGYRGQTIGMITTITLLRVSMTSRSSPAK